jgi:hypothetical protein
MKPLTFVLIILLLASCAPKTQEAAVPPRVLEKGETLLINQTLYLKTFPRSVVYEMSEDKNRTTYAFYTPLLIENVFDTFHYQLVGNGWTQTSLRKFEKDYEGLYSKQGEKLTVTLRLEDDRYIFETR